MPVQISLKSSKRFSLRSLIAGMSTGAPSVGRSAARPVGLPWSFRVGILAVTALWGGQPVAVAQHQHELHPVPGVPMKTGNPTEGKIPSDPEARSGHHFQPPPVVPGLSAPEWSGQGVSEADQAAHAYTLETLLDLAAQNNPTLIQSRLHINAQLARAMQAGLYPNPRLSYVAEQIGLDGTAGEWQGAEVQQRFVTGGKLELSRNKYLQRARVAEHMAVAQQFRVCNDVRISFAKSLTAARIVDLRKELLKTAEDRVVTVREMHNLGQANQVDAHRAIAHLQQHRLALLQATNDLRRHLLELTALVGLEIPHPQLQGSIVGERPFIDFDQAMPRILQSSPELLAAHAKLREDCITLDREKVEWIPDIVVTAGPGYNSVDRQTTTNAQVTVEIPLFDRNQGTIAQARADLSRQKNEIRRTELDLRQRLADQYDAYLTAYQNVLEFEAVILPARRDAYRLSLISYQENRLEWPDVLHEQEDYAMCRIDYLKHQQQQRISEILIDGFLLRGGLTAPDDQRPRGHIDSVPKPR